jgi:NRPS condensation-like uncharacterized protein
MKRPLTRYLSHIEREAWIYSTVQACNICYRVRLQGPFPFDRVARALEILRDVHPLAACRVVVDQHDRPYFTTEDVSEIPIEIYEGEASNQWQKVFQVELNRKFDSNLGPLLRVSFIRFPNFTDVILTSHHMCSDAMSITIYARDFLRLLSSWDFNGYAEQLPPSLSELAARCNVVEFSEGNVPLFVKGEATPTSYTSLDICHWVLPSRITHSLLSACRRERTTMHALISTSIMLCLESRHSEKKLPITIQSPVDLRPSLPLEVQEAYGFFIGLACVTIEREERRSLWEDVRHFKNLLVTAASVNRLFSSILSVEKEMSPLSHMELLSTAFQMQPNYDISISNLRTIPLASQYGNLAIESINFAPSVSPGERILIVSTFGDELSLSFIGACNDNVSSTLSECINVLREIS